jgi:hypothetical protein
MDLLTDIAVAFFRVDEFWVVAYIDPAVGCMWQGDKLNYYSPTHCLLPDL